MEDALRTVLYGVLQHLGGELSAHQMIVAEQERWSSIAQLGAEYETIRAVAQRERCVHHFGLEWGPGPGGLPANDHTALRSEAPRSVS